MLAKFGTKIACSDGAEIAAGLQPVGADDRKRYVMTDTRTMRMERRQAGVRLLGWNETAAIVSPIASPTPEADRPKPHRRKRR